MGNFSDPVSNMVHSQQCNKSTVKLQLQCVGHSLAQDWLHQILYVIAIAPIEVCTGYAVLNKLPFVSQLPGQSGVLPTVQCKLSIINVMSPTELEAATAGRFLSTTPATANKSLGYC